MNSGIFIESFKLQIKGNIQEWISNKCGSAFFNVMFENALVGIKKHSSFKDAESILY